MSVNFNTDNLIIACYRPGTGGKTVLNALGLSDGVTLQCQDLATKQLNKLLTQTDKFNILIDRLAHTDKHWSDLNLGCFQLFGDEGYERKFLSIPNLFRFFPVIDQLSNSNLQFCLVAHSYPELLNRLQVWPNARVIFLVNPDEFLKTHRMQYLYNKRVLSWWHQIRTELWPLLPPRTQLEFDNLEWSVKNELTTKFGHELYYLQDDRAIEEKNQKESEIRNLIANTNQTLIWDCDWHLTEDAFVENIEHFYKILSLTDFNREYVSTYYKNWIACLATAK